MESTLLAEWEIRERELHIIEAEVPVVTEPHQKRLCEYTLKHLENQLSKEQNPYNRTKLEIAIVNRKDWIRKGKVSD